MDVFINPAPYGEMKFRNDKEVRLLSYPTSKLVSPEDGVVIEPLKPFCDNSIQIRHFVNEQYIISVFCGVEQQFVSHGDKIRKNQIIGKFGDDGISYHIINGDGKKIGIEKYFRPPVASKEYDKEKVKKKETEKIEKEKEENKKKGKEKNKKRNNTGESGAENVFLDMLLLPFSAVSAGTKKVKDTFTDDDKKENKKLQESINRIKKLL
jgi:hypothetical protein